MTKIKYDKIADAMFIDFETDLKKGVTLSEEPIKNVFFHFDETTKKLTGIEIINASKVIGKMK